MIVCFNYCRNVDVIRVGSYTITKPETPTMDVKANKVICQQHYSNHNLYNDIAIIFLSAPTGLATPPICLPTGDLNDLFGWGFPGQSVLTAGWGKTERGPQSEVLQEARLTVVPSNECNASILSQKILTKSFPQGLDENLVCARDLVGRMDSCTVEII